MDNGKNGAAAVALAAGLVGIALTAQAARETRVWNDGWEFSRSETADFRPVAVPHDWAIAGPFDPWGNCDTGQLPWKGVGYYRKTFVLASNEVGRATYLDFDGVMCRSHVYVNGYCAASYPYGYLGYRADATPYLQPGTNTVLVKVSTEDHGSRWYPGAGIYRRVTWTRTDDLAVAHRSLFVTTPSVTDARATVRVKADIASRLFAESPAEVTVSLFAPDGKKVAARTVRLSIESWGKASVDELFTVEKPVRWDIYAGNLYRCEVAVAGSGAADAESVRFGVRDFRFDADKGFFLNGRRVQLNGVDLHADLGLVGMAFNASLFRRQMEIMKDMGVNALRTSHNPPAPEALDICDEMGIFVWDEAFDKWDRTAGRRTDENLEDYCERVLRDFVLRDRNHPCVFVWSEGNEIWSGPNETSPARIARFRSVVRALDRTRPVGMGCCFWEFGARGEYDSLDLTGWNYREKYWVVRNRNAKQPLIYSESASAFSSPMGYYGALPTNKVTHAVADRAITGYDYASAFWSDIPDKEFERMERDTFCAGEFVWTGIDYLGEPSPYVPNPGSGCEEIAKLPRNEFARSSYFGICDLLCFPKDRFYLYRAHWNRRDFTLHVLPHWTHSGREGEALPVFVYTSAPTAELFVNGKSMGRRTKDVTQVSGASCRDFKGYVREAEDKDYYNTLDRYRLRWMRVPYEPGELKVVAYGADGKVLGEKIVKTAGAPAKVTLAAERDVLPDDGETMVFVRVGVADAKGVKVPTASDYVRFALTGPGEIVSVGNADPRGHRSFKEIAGHELYLGAAAAVVRRTGAGRITLTASAQGLESASVSW